MKCKQCGWCCNNTAINICHSDIMRWYNDERLDILYEVSFIDDFFYILRTALHPNQQCPFFDKLCSIYETRPMVCKDFPIGSRVQTCHIYESANENRYVITEAKMRQYNDFKLAYDNRHMLIDILTEVNDKVIK